MAIPGTVIATGAGPRPDCMDASADVRRWVWSVLALALAVRLGAAVGLNWYLNSRIPPQQYLIAGDAEGYWDLAGDIASGAEYAVYTPPRRVLRMPGFPALLALSRLCCGDRLDCARLWLACIGTFAVWGVWRLGAEAVDPATGLLAALWATYSPVLVLFSPVELSETSFAAALLLSLLGAVRLLRQHIPGSIVRPPDMVGPRSSARTSICTGLGMALATYIRPSWLLVAPLLGGCLMVLSADRARAARDAVIVNAVLLLALLPWGLRNQAVTGHFTLTTFWMGPSLYDGLNPSATGDSDMTFFDRDNLSGQGWSEYEIDRHYRAAAWTFARQNPGRALELAALKLWRYWKPWPNADQFRHPLASLAVAASFGPALVLAVVGLWRRRTDWPLLIVTLGPILYFSAVHLFFVSSLRYRLPAEYPLLVLSAVGLQACLPKGCGPALAASGEDAA